MKFKQYLENMANQSVSQPIVPDEEVGGQEVTNPSLGTIVDEQVNHPSEGIEKVIEVLSANGLSLPIMFDFYEEGDELVVELTDDLYLYVIYAEENGLYDFYAELVDDDGLEEILEDEDETEEE